MQYILERSQTSTQSGLPVYLRTYLPSASGASSDQAAQFGFQVSASGSQVTQDTQVLPQPIVLEVPMRDIGLNAAQLSFGARKFIINQEFVLAIQQQNNYTDPNTGQPDYYRVFRDSSVVGLFYNDRLFKIVSLTHNDVADAPYQWTLVCNAAEQPPTS